MKVWDCLTLFSLFILYLDMKGASFGHPLQKSFEPTVISDNKTHLDTNPGIKLKITQKGLDFGIQFGLEFLKQTLKEMVIDDWTGKDTTGLTGANCTISKIKIKNVNFPTVSTFFIPENKIHVAIDEASLILTADWELNSWLLTNSGKMTVLISGVSVAATVTISEDQTGYPLLSLASCQGNIGGLNIQLDQESSWLYKIIANFLERPVRQNVNLCPIIDTKIEDLNVELRNHQKRIQIDAFSAIDYTLVHSPSISKTFMNVDFKGTVYPAADGREPPFKPDIFILPNETDSMFSIGVSEYFFQTASLAYYEAGAFNISADKSAAEQLSAFFMLTTEKFENMIPMVAHRYAKPLPVMMDLTATAAPVIKLYNDNFILVLAASMDLLAVHPNNTIQSMFALNVTAKINISFTILDNNLIPSFCLDSFKILLAHSNIGFFKASNLESFVSYVLKNGIVPAANVLLKEGIALPTWNTILEQPVVKVYQGYLVFSTDVKFKSSFFQGDYADI